MKKNTPPAIPEKTDGKGAFYHAGEIIGSIGFHIIDGKDKVVGAIKNKLSKKQTPESKVKKVSKKKLPGKAGKKATGGIKKQSKKANPAKRVGNKTDQVKKPAKSTKEKE